MIERRVNITDGNGSAAGSITIPLRETLSQKVLDALDLEDAGFAMLVVTGGHIDPGSVTVEQLTQLARVTAIYRTLADDGLSIEGAGLAVLMGDENDKGPLSNVASAGSTDRTFKEWVELWPSVSDHGMNGLTFGDIEDIPGDFKQVIDPGVTLRTWLDRACEAADAEWRVRNDLTIHAGTVDELYGDPTVVVTRDPGHRQSNVLGIQAVLGGQSDVEDWTSDAEVYYRAGGVDDGALESVTIGANPYVDVAGDPLVMGRVVDGNRTANSDTAATIGAKAIARTDGVRRQIDIQADQYDIGGIVNPGDRIYVYDPRLGYIGSTQIEYRAEIIRPMTLRVHAVSFPIEQGMGAYLIVGASDIFDLTDWVAFESGPASLEVGASRRSLQKRRRRGQAA